MSRDINQDLFSFSPGIFKALELKYTMPVLLALHANQDIGLSMTEIEKALERYQFGHKMVNVHKPSKISIRKAVGALELSSLVWSHFHGSQRRIGLTSWGLVLVTHIIGVVEEIESTPLTNL